MSFYVMKLYLNKIRMSTILTLIATLIAHGVIFIISIIEILILLSLNAKEYTFIIVFLNILILYFYSGYLLSKDKMVWYRYIAIAIIGIILWLFCFAESPESLNYKSDNQAGLWFFYRLYISGIESPLNYITKYNNIEEFQLFYILTYPILASLLQYLGALFKINKMIKATKPSN